MKKLATLFAICVCFIAKSQPVCNTNGNLMIFTNYDGGHLTINVDQNIPNLKIGICSYEACDIILTGAFVSNVTAVHYAGYNGGNSTSCGAAIATTTITGAPVGAVTSTIFAPAATISNANGYGSIICGYSCNNSTSQGGCNTVDQVEAYFVNYFSGSALYAHMVQYGCWSTTQALSAGGNCCPAAPPTLTFSPGTVAGSQTVCAGSYSAFTSVNAANGSTAAITYTWQSSFTSPTSGFADIPGANNLTYLPPSGGPAYYRRAASTPVDPTVYSNVLNVYENPLPFLSAASVDPFTCAGSQATLVAVSPGNTFTSVWQPGSLTGNSLTVTPQSSSDYTVLITDQNGCNSEAVVPVLVFSMPTVQVTASVAVCAGQQATLSASGASMYVWMPGNLSGTEITITPSSASSVYTVTGYYALAVCGDSHTISLSALPLPTVSLVADKPRICKGESAVLTGSGAVSFTMYPAAGPLLSPSVAVSPTISTTYTTIGAGANGCTAMAVKELTVNGCTGIFEDGGSGSELQIFPNPSNGEFYIHSQNAASLDIINTSGRLVKHIELSRMNDYQMSVSDLAPGIYFVVSSGYAFKRKIVVLK